MIIKSAKFIISNTEYKKCPDTQLPEYAFIGRSNVGKSSLINMITNHKNLAKTSGTPGKTQLINHFLINDQWHLVDLPGYGYAQVPNGVKKEFQKLITAYIENRKQLLCTFVLIDSRLKAQKNDLEFMEYLGENGFPFVIVFTKSDKLKKKELETNIADYTQVLLDSAWEETPPHFITSAANKTGKEEILAYIDHINIQIKT